MNHSPRLDRSIWPQILSHAAHQPDAIALICDDQILSYSTLIDEVAARIAQLPDSLIANAHQAHQDADQARQPRVGVYLEQGMVLVCWVLALVATGANPTIFDSSWPDAEVKKRCKQLDATCLITANLQPFEGVVLCPLDQQNQQPGFTLKQHQAENKGVDMDPLAQDRKASMFLFTGLTSASAGPAKAYQRTEDSWLKTFGFDQKLFAFMPGNVIAAPGPLGHSLFLYATMRGLYVGATVWLTSRFAPRQVLKHLHTAGVTHLFAVPSYLHAVCDQYQHVNSEPVKSLKWIISSGAKLDESARKKIAQLGVDMHIAEIFGTSEHSTITMAHTHDYWPQGSVGKPPKDVVVSIVDEDGQALPPDEVGEIYVNSPALFSGYAGQNAPKVQVHQKFGLSVGDMGWVDDDGYLYLAGRRDRMILSKGYTLYPEPIETMLAHYAPIERALVMGIKDDKRGERLVAFVSFKTNVKQKGDVPTASALIRHLCTTLPDHAVPRRFFQVQRWPLTRSGKIDVHTMRRLHALSAFKALY